MRTAFVYPQPDWRVATDASPLTRGLQPGQCSWSRSFVRELVPRSAAGFSEVRDGGGQQQQMLNSIIHHFLGGCLGVFAKEPTRITEEYSEKIQSLSRSWSTTRCGGLSFDRYSCPAVEGDPCIFSVRTDRNYRSYEFGPLGWSGGPPEHPAAHKFDFLGMRLDVLSREPESVHCMVMAHEMAHERQRFCSVSDEESRWSLSLLALEGEAEAEAKEHERDNGHSLNAAFLTLTSLLRAPVAALLSSLSLLAMLILVPLIIGAATLVAFVIYRTWPNAPFLPPWLVMIAPRMLVFSVIVMIAYRFFLGVQLSWYYARRFRR